MTWRWSLVFSAVIALGYTALWFELADRMESRVQDGLESAAAEGVETTAGAIERSGFPHRIALVIEGLALAAGEGGESLALAAERVSLFARPWRPDRLSGEARRPELELGRYAISAPQAELELHAGAEAVHAGALFIDARLLRDGEPSADIAGLAIRVTLPEARPEADPGLLAPERARIELTAREIRPDPSGGVPMEELAIEAALHGAIAPPFDRAALAAWRDGGGTLEVDRLDLGWGGVRLEAHGSLTLDDALRPLGALTLEVDDPQALLARLEAAGLIAPGLARQLVQVLDMLPPPRPGEAALSLPLSLQNGQVFLATVPIAAM